MDDFTFKDINKNENSTKRCFDKLLIPHDSRWKNIFDMIVLILTGYSCISLLF